MAMGKTSARKYRRTLRELENVQAEMAAELRSLGYEIRSPTDAVAAMRDLALQVKAPAAPAPKVQEISRREPGLLPMNTELDLDLGFNLEDLDLDATPAPTEVDMEEIGRLMKAKAEAKLAGLSWQGSPRNPDDPGQVAEVSATEGLKTVRELQQR